MRTTTDKLTELFEDCLESEGDPAMRKTARVLTDAELKTVAGGPRISNEGGTFHMDPRVSNE